MSGATLNGLVTDAQGGAVVGAKVSAKNQGTGIATETDTNEAGAYTIPNLGAADYEVTVTATGFKTAVSKVTLIVGAKQQMNFAMVVGEVAQTVEVTAAAPQVDLTSSTITDEVAASTVRELPLNGRDWASLAQLQPSVVEARTHLDVTHVGGGGGRGFGDQLSIGGGRPTQNSYRLDGVLVNDYSNAGPGSVLGKNLGVDAIQEFTVLTSNYSAEYGFTSGGVINAITKTGTNSFHGTAFDFLRNSILDANDFFANAAGLGKSPLVQNQFGAAGGYKILKDKFFLFGDYEGVRQAAGLPTTGQITISNAVRAGTVTNISCVNASTSLQASSECQKTVNIATIDPNIMQYLSLFPQPNGGAVDANTGIYNFLGHRAASEDFVTARGDYKISDKDSLFATFLRDNSNFNTPEVFGDAQQGFNSYRQAIITEETHIFSTTFTNTVRGGLDRTENLGGNTPIVNNPAMSNAALGQLPGFYSSAVTLTGTGATALTGGLGYGASIQDFWGQIRQFYDDAFWSHGNHGFKFGFAAVGYQVDGYTPLQGGNGSGTFSSRGIYPVVGGSQVGTTIETGCLAPNAKNGMLNLASPSTGYDASCGALVNFLTNQPLTATRTVDLSLVHKHYLRQKVFAGYFQDDWRFKSNLTLNLGLRYEMSTDPYEKYGNADIMTAPTTLLPCGGGPPACATALPQSAERNTFFTNNPTTKNFEPRIGFAWDPFKDGKTSVRGGFGIFDALPLAYELILNNTSAAPARPAYVALGPGAGGLEASAPSIAGGTATTTSGEWPFVIPSKTQIQNFSPLSRSWQYVEGAPKRNYVYQYNFNIERQFTPTLSLLVGYTGSRGLHNPFQADTINTVVPQKIAATGQYYWPVNYDLNQVSSTSVGTGYVGDPNNPCPTISYTSTTFAAPQNCYLLNTSTSSGMFNTDWQARSWYNALQIKLDKRMGHGFQVQVAYTYSKSMDDSSGSTAGDTFSTDIVSEPWYDLSLNRGLSDFDVRNNIVINGLWNVPTAPRMGTFGDKVLGGWQLGIITTIGSGVPESASFTAFNTSADIAGEIQVTNQPPNVNAGCSPQGLVNANYRHTLLYINASCLGFVPETAANAPFCDTLRGGLFTGFCPNIRGDLGRDTIIGPGLFDMDFSVFKNNYIRKISETFNVQFRAEMFNVLNHANFQPTTNLNPISNTNGTPAPTFGQLTATQVPDREIQMAIKLIW